MIPALSIRQPWAWLIVHGHKYIENRASSTPFLAQVPVHAGLTMTLAYYEQITEEQGNADMLPVGRLPSYEDLQRGALVGWTRVLDCREHNTSKWKQEGSCGFVLRDSRPTPFVPWRGHLNFFNAPEHALKGIRHEAR